MRDNVLGRRLGIDRWAMRDEIVLLCLSIARCVVIVVLIITDAFLNM
jgi:hypothetical protein